MIMLLQQRSKVHCIILIRIIPEPFKAKTMHLNANTCSININSLDKPVRCYISDAKS